MNATLFKEQFQTEFEPVVKRFSETNGLPPWALLFDVNTTCDPSDKMLVCSNIKAILLPTNHTPVLHPMDQNALQNVKISHKKMLLRALIEDKHNSLLKLKKVTIKDIIYQVTKSYDHLNQ